MDRRDLSTLSEFYTKSEPETRKAGREFSKLLKPGDNVVLTGGLGCGKTTFVKGVAKGFGINDNIRSPSFVIVNEYCASKVKLYHMDLYRLEAAAIADLGIEEYLCGGGVCIIEWGEKLNHLNEGFWKISIKRIDDNKRKFTVSRHA